jgi:uncharacterized cupredoxin-like copper-binding protein
VKAALLAVGIAAAALMPGAAAAGPQIVEITIHHSTFIPSHLSFPAGATVRFVIHNTDPIDHEFIVGSRIVQFYVEHTSERVHGGAVPGQVSVPAGTTRETTYTFGRAEPMLFGCHLPGHYRYGMRGTIGLT